MGALVYTLPADLLFGQGTLSSTGPAVDANHPLAKVIDGLPDEPCYFEDAGDVGIVRQFVGAQRIDAAGIPIGNIPAGASFFVQANTANVWTDPPFEVEHVVGAYDADGFFPRTWIDFRDLEGFPFTTFNYWRLFVPDIGAPLQLGEWWLAAQVRELGRTVEWELEDARTHRTTINRAAGGRVHVYEHGTKQLRITVPRWKPLPADLAAMRIWQDSARGDSRAFLVVADPDVSPPIIARFAQPTYTEHATKEDALVFEELARGRVLDFVEAS